MGAQDTCQEQNTAVHSPASRVGPCSAPSCILCPHRHTPLTAMSQETVRQLALGEARDSSALSTLQSHHPQDLIPQEFLSWVSSRFYFLVLQPDMRTQQSQRSEWKGQELEYPQARRVLARLESGHPSHASPAGRLHTSLGETRQRSPGGHGVGPTATPSPRSILTRRR